MDGEFRENHTVSHKDRYRSALCQCPRTLAIGIDLARVNVDHSVGPMPRDHADLMVRRAIEARLGHES